MKRPSFLKSVGKSVVAVLGIGAGSSKAKAEKKTNGYQKPNYLDISPDEILSCEIYHGRLLVFCEHSIWEIERDGDIFQKKLLGGI